MCVFSISKAILIIAVSVEIKIDCVCVLCVFTVCKLGYTDGVFVYVCVCVVYVKSN